jgi:hypothetical protein
VRSNSKHQIVKVVVGGEMVSDVGDDDQIFRHREQRVDTRLAVGVVSVEEVHGSRDAHVVQNL